MKILVLCSSHYIDDGRVTRKQAVSLSKLGHEVTICARRINDYDENSVKLIDINSLPMNVKAKKWLRLNINNDRINRLLRLPGPIHLCKTNKT